MFDSKKLEDYLRFASNYSDSSIVPKGANNVKVLNIKKLSGGITNNVYSFLLTFTMKGFETRFDLVLKSYTNDLGMWFRIYHPDEDVRQYMREFQTMRILERIGYPVPAVYLCECDSFFLGHPFVIMKKEKVKQEMVTEIDCFASTLARLHNLRIDELGIISLRFPRDSSEFARERLVCLKQFLNETRHYRGLKKDFNYAIDWLESNMTNINCPQYCLIHGEYHPGHTLVTNDNKVKVIDWEMVEIGDPAFDVGYAYNMVKLIHNEKNANSGERAAQQFLSEYSKNFQGDVHSRLEFYKVVGLLGVAIVVSSWISNPLEADRRFGHRAMARALAFPFLRSRFLAKKWINADFLVHYLQYCQDFIETTLR
jgi:aminoglycoside phosphotransferase (APT) family kinase protein